jgi:hypothetical protein
VLQKAEQDSATDPTISEICKYAAKIGQNLTPENLKKKTDREKPRNLVFTAFRGFYLPYTFQCYAGTTANHHCSGNYQVLRPLPRRSPRMNDPLVLG